MSKRAEMTRGIVAAALVAVAAITGSAHATQAVPAVLATSVDGGWAANGPIAARFDRGVDGTASTATLVDRDGTTYPGTLTAATSIGHEKDTLIFQVTLGRDETLLETNAPYEITFVAKGAAATEGTTEVSRTFTFDLTRPVAIISKQAQADTPTVVAPGGSIQINGAAYDATSVDDLAAAYRSGLSAVDVRFYNLLKPNGTSGLGGEATELRQMPALTACTVDTPGCERGADKAWSADTSKVGPGHWTVKVYAIDRAGNRSLAASDTFTKLG